MLLPEKWPSMRRPKPAAIDLFLHSRWSTKPRAGGTVPDQLQTPTNKLENNSDAYYSVKKVLKQWNVIYAMYMGQPGQ